MRAFLILLFSSLVFFRCGGVALTSEPVSIGGLKSLSELKVSLDIDSELGVKFSVAMAYKLFIKMRIIWNRIQFAHA